MKLLIIYVCILLVKTSTSLNLEHLLTGSLEQKNPDIDANRPRRDVIEEEFYNVNLGRSQDQMQDSWVPGKTTNDKLTAKITTSTEVKSVVPLQTTKKALDKSTGRGARASNENWIKLPFSGRDQEDFSQNKPSGDLINSRMPRVDFVTQNKGLEAQESRDSKESIHRARHEEIRTEFVRPDEHIKPSKPVYPRQALYYPEESRRRYYGVGYNPDTYYNRSPFKDYLYDRRIPVPLERGNTFDEEIARKPKRIIYYANLPEVVRPLPPYRPPEPYRRIEDDYERTARFDPRFRSRIPYSYRYDNRLKDDRFRDVDRYRDLAYAGSNVVDKERNIYEKVTAAPVLPASDSTLTNSKTRNYKDQIHNDDDAIRILFRENISHKALPEREEHSYYKFDEPTLLHSSIIDNPYRMF